MSVQKKKRESGVNYHSEMIWAFFKMEGSFLIFLNLWLIYSRIALHRICSYNYKKDNIMKNLEREKTISIGMQYLNFHDNSFYLHSTAYTVQNIIGYETVSLILLLILFLLPLFNFSRGPIILLAVIGAFAWDYYFIPPHFTMYIARPEDVMMLLMFFIVAVTNGVLASKVNIQK